MASRQQFALLGMRPRVSSKCSGRRCDRRHMLLEMATGDPNMPKGGHPDDIAMLRATDDKHVCGPRTGWKRKKGEFGYGAYGDEPWSLQSMEKRLYAIRDFYKRELKGTEMDNRGHDDLVEGTRAALVLLIGRKATHVPQVRAHVTDREY